MQLYIGNQNYSTWSLRAWLIFSQYGLPVTITKLPLFTDEFYRTLNAHFPVAKVPALNDNGVKVWDSLAILEYVNEHCLAGEAWPSDRAEKAKARSLAAEMHSGFSALRSELPMNCRAKRKVVLSEQARLEIARVDRLWSEQMMAYPQGWLFGDWSITDAMYAPLALRFMTYGIELSTPAKRYQDKVLDSKAVKQWLAEAELETDIVAEDEAGVPV